MMMNGSKVTELANRATAAAARLDDIYGRRRALALDASEGDKSALEQIAAIDAEARELLAKKLMLTDAVLLAEEQDRTRQAEREAADAARHLAEATKLAAAALKTTEQIDATMVALTKLFEKRAELFPSLVVPVVSPQT